jgi:hypothetical protein
MVYYKLGASKQGPRAKIGNKTSMIHNMHGVVSTSQDYLALIAYIDLMFGR